MKTFLCISSFQVLAMFRRGLFYNFLAIYLCHFMGLSVTATTLFATLPMVVNVAAQRYLWGILSDRYQKRRSLIVWGEILAGIGTILLWYVHRMPQDRIHAGWVVIWGLTVIEIFWSMSNIGWSALISDLYDAGDRSTVMGRLESLGGVGRIIGVLSGGLLYDKMGTEFEGWGFYEGPLFWISGLIMFLSLVPMIFVPEGGIKGAGSETRPIIHKNEKNSRLFIILILAMGFIHFGRNSIAVTLPQYLSLESGLDLSALTLSHVVNIRSLGLIITGIFAGRLCRKLGDRPMLIFSSALASAALLLIAVSDRFSHICISSFFMGFSEVLIMAASYELASFYIPPEKRGELFAIFNAALFLSWGMAGTFIAGPVVDGLIRLGKPETFAYQASFLASAGVTLTGVAILLYLFRIEKRTG
jgi:MFS family permease